MALSGDDAELKITLRAIADELLAGMDKATSSVDRATGSMQRSFQQAEEHVSSSIGNITERVSVGLSGISGQIRGFGEIAEAAFAVLAGERIAANVVRDTQDWAFSVEHLTNALGISAQEASIWAVAAKEAGVPIETIDAASRGLIRQLNSSGEAFQHLGIATKDAQGNFLPFPELLRNVLNSVDEYKAGTDRAAAAQSVFGSRMGGENLANLRRWLEELSHAREVASAFGVQIGEDGVAKARAFERATADLSLAALGVKETIAEALRPELENLIAQITELARDGTLQAWAKDVASDVTTVGHGIADVTGFLIEHAKEIEAAAIAWGIYRAALLTTATAEAVVASLARIRDAVLAVQAASTLGTALSAAGGAVGASLVANLAGGITGAAQAAAAFTSEGVAAEALGASLAGLGTTMGIAVTETAAIGTATVAATGTMGTLEAAVIAATTALGPAGIVAVLLGSGAAFITYEGWWGRIADAIGRAIDKAEQFAGIKKPGEFDLSPETEPFKARDTFTLSPATEPFSPDKSFHPDDKGKAEKAAFEALKQQRDADLADVEHNEAEKLAIVQRFALQVLNLRGVTNAQLLEADRALHQQTQRAEDQDAQVRLIGIQEVAKERLKDIAEEQKGVTERLRLGEISVAEAIAQEKALADEKYTIQTNALQAELELYRDRPVEAARINAQIEAAERDHVRELEAIDREAQKALLDQWKETASLIDEAFKGLGSGFSSALKDLVDQNALAVEHVVRDHVTGQEKIVKSYSVSAKIIQDIYNSLENTLLHIIEQIAARQAEIAAVKYILPGSEAPSSNKGKLDDQFSGGLVALLGKLFGGGTAAPGQGQPGFVGPVQPAATSSNAPPIGPTGSSAAAPTVAIATDQPPIPVVRGDAAGVTNAAATPSASAAPTPAVSSEETPAPTLTTVTVSPVPLPVASPTPLPVAATTPIPVAAPASIPIAAPAPLLVTVTNPPGAPTPPPGIAPGAPPVAASPEPFVGPPAPPPAAPASPTATPGAPGTDVAAAVSSFGQLESLTQQSQAKQTAIVQAGILQRAALLVRGFAQEIASLVQHAAQALGIISSSETAKTTAISVGEASQAGAAEAGVAAKKAISAEEATQDKKDVLSAAASAAAKVYSFIAGSIPYVGPILGAAAAAVVFAAIAGFGSFISAEGGADLGSGGPFPAVLHENELVLPAPLADGVRQLVATGTSGTAGAAGADASSTAVRLGQTTTSASIPVTLASDQTPLQVTTAPSGSGETPASSIQEVTNPPGSPILTMQDAGPGGAQSVNVTNPQSNPANVTQVGGFGALLFNSGQLPGTSSAGGDEIPDRPGGFPRTLHRRETVLPADKTETLEALGRALRLGPEEEDDGRLAELVRGSGAGRAVGGNVSRASSASLLFGSSVDVPRIEPPQVDLSAVHRAADQRASELRAETSAASRAASEGGTTQHFNPSFTINALDSADVKSWLHRNRGDILKELGAGVAAAPGRRANP